MLAKVWKKSNNPTGYWMSEKYDGVRAIWTGTQLMSRNGNPLYAPSFWTKDLPADVQLDGELSMGRNTFQDTVSIVRSSKKDSDWNKIRYLVFDTIHDTDLFEQRIERIPRNHPFIDVVQHISCRDQYHMDSFFDHVHSSLGGEGIMLRAPKSVYFYGRSNMLYKVKSFLDEDAVVIGYISGKGRLEGKIGALVVKGPGGKTFRLGTGLSEHDRLHPPPINSVVTYKYQEITRDGNPRFPVYMNTRTIA